MTTLLLFVAVFMLGVAVGCVIMDHRQHSAACRASADACGLWGAAPPPPPTDACGCRRCRRERDPRPDPVTMAWVQRQQVFIVCDACGNKRCPRATDHRLACTGSNEPGQPGSVFQ